MLKKLNNYFICDEDETPSATDYIFFYGFYTLVTIIIVFSIIGLVRGVN